MIATLAALMLYTGMRKEEAVALRGEDIDWENDVIHITKAVNVKDGKLKQTKTTAGVRDVPLLDPIKIALAQMPDKGLLFPNTLGDYMCESTFKRRWNAYIKSLGCEPFTPHDLRYTFATMLYDADVDIKTAQYLLGHSDVAVTMGIYTQLSREKFARGIGKPKATVKCSPRFTSLTSAARSDITPGTRTHPIAQSLLPTPRSSDGKTSCTSHTRSSRPTINRATTYWKNTQRTQFQPSTTK